MRDVSRNVFEKPAPSKQDKPQIIGLQHSYTNQVAEILEIWNERSVVIIEYSSIVLVSFDSFRLSLYRSFQPKTKRVKIMMNKSLSALAG